MNLYFAGSFTGQTTERLKEMGMQHKLYSYVHEKKLVPQWGSQNLILDSGAFTAFTKGKTIKIEELVKFCEEHKPQYAIQLDVIGDPEASWENWKKSEQMYPMLPVLHAGATDTQIKRVLTAAPYICLGALVPLAKRRTLLTSWLDHVFSFKEARGVKMHCLGIMQQDILLRYPFYSADSSSALSAVRFPMEKNPLIRMRQQQWHYREMYYYPIQEQVTMQDFVTRVWTKRGIIWD
jgi:hypothetical protein